MLRTTKFAFTVLLFSMVLMAPSVLAETSFVFSSLFVNVEEGETFRLAVSIDPEGVKNYTVKLELDYPADLLKITSFTFNSAWIQIVQPGYNLIDNSKGAMIKTAGFPGGVAAPKNVGTVTFLAKKKGNGLITVGGTSFVLDDKNQNVLAETPVQVSVTITKKITPKVAKPLPEFEIPEEILEGYTFEKALGLGEKNIDVAYLQLCLTSQGVYSDDITGYFGSLTEKAVRDFQENYFDEILTPLGFEKGTGRVDQTTRTRLNEVCFAEPEEIPEQLFDINFEIDDSKIATSKELTSRVLFTSFGRVPTPVDLTFIIQDEFGREVHREKDAIVVETEAVFAKTFEGLALTPGNYTLVLRTLYNVDVRDEFRQDFEIIQPAEENVRIWSSLWFWVLIVLVFAVILIVIVKRTWFLKG